MLSTRMRGGRGGEIGSDAMRHQHIITLGKEMAMKLVKKVEIWEDNEFCQEAAFYTPETEDEGIMFNAFVDAAHRSLVQDGVELNDDSGNGVMWSNGQRHNVTVGVLCNGDSTLAYCIEGDSDRIYVLECGHFAAYKTHGLSLV